jgi:hypothetical protein
LELVGVLLLPLLDILIGLKGSWMCGCVLDKVVFKILSLMLIVFAGIELLPENEVHKASFATVLYILLDMPLSLTRIVTSYSHAGRTTNKNLAYTSIQSWRDS